jgi:S1-C subfamily serine protease
MYLNIIVGNSGGVLLNESGKLIEITIWVNSNYNKNNLFRGSMIKKG